MLMRLRVFHDWPLNWKGEVGFRKESESTERRSQELITTDGLFP